MIYIAKNNLFFKRENERERERGSETKPNNSNDPNTLVYIDIL